MNSDTPDAGYRKIAQIGSFSTVLCVILGILAALFFSVTFITNRYLSLESGSWIWWSVLRYVWTGIFISIAIVSIRGTAALMKILQSFRDNLFYWSIAGGIGYGVFYSSLCYGSQFSSAWLVAVTWQTTIIFSPIVLMLFGVKVPIHIWPLLLTIFCGIVISQWSSNVKGDLSRSVFEDVLPIFLAAVCYPIGSQLVMAAREGRYDFIAESTRESVKDPFACVLLLTLGSMPWWLAVLGFGARSLPTTSELGGTALVALGAGVIGTSIFLWARNRAQDGYSIAAVDSTQSFEVVCTIFLEFAFLGILPSGLAWLGILFVTFGLFLIPLSPLLLERRGRVGK